MNHKPIEIFKPSLKTYTKSKNFIDFLGTKKSTLNMQDRYYDDHSTKFPVTTVWDIPYYRSINQTEISFLGNVKSKLVLDLGSGIGEDTQFLSKNGAIIVSLDSSEKSLKISQQVNDNLHVRADATNLPFKNGVFDIVFGREVLHHVDEKITLNEVRRILKIGGYAVFEEPLKFNPLVVIYRFIKKDERVPQHSFAPSHLSKLAIHYFKKSESKSFYMIFPFFYVFILYFPATEAFLTKLYMKVFSTLDDYISWRFPFFSWLQVVKLYK